MQGEAAGANVDAAASFPDLAEIIDEGGHPEQQIFTGDETDFSQKMPSMQDLHSKREIRWPGFKAPEDRLSLVRGEAAGDFGLKTVTILEVLGPVRTALNLLCLCSLRGRAKPGRQHFCLQCDVLNVSSPLSGPTAQKKSLKILPLIDSAPGRPRTSGDEQEDECFHACSLHGIHSAVHGLRSNFKFQVLLFKKYISRACGRQLIMIPLMDLSQVDGKPSGKESPF